MNIFGKGKAVNRLPLRLIVRLGLCADRGREDAVPQPPAAARARPSKRHPALHPQRCVCLRRRRLRRRQVAAAAASAAVASLTTRVTKTVGTKKPHTMKAAAVDEISVAIRKDNAGDFVGAVAAYACGIDLFEALLAGPSTESEQFQDAVRLRVDGYRSRTSELRAIMAKAAEAAPSAAASAAPIDGTAIITEAVRADQRQDYATAIELYERGVQLLEARLAAELPTDSLQLRDAVRLRVIGYLERCAALRDVMRLRDDAPRAEEADAAEPAAWMSLLVRPKEPDAAAESAYAGAIALASGSSAAASAASPPAAVVPCTLAVGRAPLASAAAAAALPLLPSTLRTQTKCFFHANPSHNLTRSS